MPPPAIAMFGGGCFWCTEAVFRMLRGVTSVTPGYAGGATPAPTYKEVCTGTTGHAEVIRVEYDPTIITYNDLLTAFFASHDPTTLNRQGNDVGSQYRSIILTTTPEQADQARAFIAQLTTHGSVDDVWVNPAGELHIVDYKATSKADEVTLDADWQIGYKRQMEFYQWLFRQNGFDVHPTGYFVYCNGDATRDTFDNKLHFNVKIIPYTGDDTWVEPTIRNAHTTLTAETLPPPGDTCDYCAYRNATRGHE